MSEYKGENEYFFNILDSIDREIAFFRRRSGQVYFFGILAEVLILSGEQQTLLPRDPLGLGYPLFMTVFL